MTAESSVAIKKLLGTVALFFTLFLVLAGLQYVTGSAADAGIRKSAETALHSWNPKAPSLGDRLPAVGAGWAFTRVYRTAGKGKTGGLVFVIPLTGNSGPFTGVFYWTKQNGPVFCGLAGLSLPDAEAESYGITDRIISGWLKKIGILAEIAGESA